MRRKKPTTNKRLLKAREFHENWLADRGLAPRQMKVRTTRVRPNTMPDLKVEEHSVPLSNGFAPVLQKPSAMEIRYREKPEVRAAIEQKAMRINSHFNKGPAQYVSDGDQTKYTGKVRK